MQKQLSLQNEQDNNYYLHTRQHPHSQRSIVKSFHAFQDGVHHHMIAIVNHNSIQIYRKVRSRVFYDKTYNFMCDITVLQIIPAKGQNTDVIFIADTYGRYLFWQPKTGGLAVSNNIRLPDYSAMPAYQKVLVQQRQIQYSGISANFHGIDTQATIFFTVFTKIVILRIRYSKNKITFLNVPIQIPIPYLDINHIGIINGKQPIIGIVQQRQQKSFLRLHKATSQHFQCISSLQKSNLTSFYCGMQGQQIITITNSQLSIYNLKTQQIFCTFQIPQSGHVCALDNDLYIYVGEVATQMIVFSKKHYKNYGGFMLQNFVCMRLNCHGKLDDGGYLISVIDQGHTVQFLGLYQQNWKSIQSLSSSSSIFMIEDLQRKNQVLAIRGNQNSFQVGILSKHLSSKLQKQTSLKSVVLSLFSVNKGKSLIVSTLQANTVFNYSQQNQIFELSFDFQSGIIVQIIDKYVVMEHKIYQMDLNKCVIKQLCNEKAGIVSADFDGKFLAFQCNDFSLKFYNTQTKQLDRIKKFCFEDYIWKFHCSETLLVGSLDLRGKLKIVPVFKQATTVTLQNQQIIVDIISHGQFVIISFSNCFIEVYQFASWKMIHKIDYAAEPLQFIKCHDKILAYGTKQSHLIKFNQQGVRVQCSQIQFDSQKQIINIAYLDVLQKFAIAHPDNLSLYSISNDQPEHASSFKIISDNVDATPPFAMQKDGAVFIVQSYELVTRSKDTGQLLKKQSHGLKQICCIQKLQMGLLVCGVNDMDSAQLFLFDYKDLQILLAQPLHKVQNYDKKTPTAIKRVGANSFFLRQDQHISLYQIKPQQLTTKQIFSTKVGIKGYSLSVQTELSMVIASDPLRYLVAYDYRLGKLVSLCRYQNLNTINDISFLGKSVVTGDCMGNLTIAEFNFDSGQVARTVMTDVGSLNIGSQISYITKGKNSVIYSTISGSVGRLRTINTQTFKKLKQAQKQIMKIFEGNKNQLGYYEWAIRPSLSDKIVDGLLIQRYLQIKVQNKKVQEQEQLSKLWQKLKKLK